MVSEPVKATWGWWFELWLLFSDNEDEEEDDEGVEFWSMDERVV